MGYKSYNKIYELRQIIQGIYQIKNTPRTWTTMSLKHTATNYWTFKNQSPYQNYFNEIKKELKSLVARD